MLYDAGLVCRTDLNETSNGNRYIGLHIGYIGLCFWRCFAGQSVNVAAT